MCRRAWRKAKPMLAWKWGEKFVKLEKSSPMPGRYRTDLTPQVRSVLNEAQSNDNSKIVVLCSAQSAKTQTLMIFFAWMVKNDPGPCFWLMAAHDDAKEFSQTRLMPMLESIEELEDVMPAGRGKRNRVLVQFATMDLMFRGSNSKSKLQSTPVRWLFLDEVRNYTRGALELVLKRIRAWRNARQFWISTAGNAHDEMHTAYLEGTRTHFHFKCLECDHSQPLRFGRTATPLFPNERQKGGLRWETNETTCPGGEWDYDELAKTIRFECENCGHLHHEHDRGRMLETLHPIDTNSRALKGVKSFWWNALYIPWVLWSDIAKEFLQAHIAFSRGNVEPLKAWCRESDGCPWEERGEKPKENELRRQCGKHYDDGYGRGQFWSEENTARVLTADVQAAAGGFLKWVLREWKPNGDSRLVNYGRVLDFDALRELQHEMGVDDSNVFIDSGWNASKVYAACVDFNWRPMKGDDAHHFVTYKGKVAIRRTFKVTLVDPSIGKKKTSAFTQRTSLPLIVWSNDSYKDRLLLHIVIGRGPVWEIPDDVSNDYCQEVLGEERRAKTNERGAITYSWHKTATNDYLDAELMQLVVADIAGLATVGSSEVSEPS